MHHLTREELKRLLEAVANPRHRLMLKVAYNHALRVSEVINLTGRACRDGFIDCQRLKGSLRTVQPFVASSDPMLDESRELTKLVAGVKPDERLFPITRFGVNKLVLRAGTKAGLPRHKLHPHVLKHSLCKHSIGTAGIENVRQYAGHRSMSSTGEYLRTDDQEAATAVHKALKYPTGRFIREE